METQAAAPGQPQAQTPVHPVHQEQATLDALTQWVKSTPENDPHAGTDMEQPAEQQEAPQEEPAAQEQETQEPVQEVEIDEEAPLFKISYKTEKGEEIKELSLKELREGYLAKQDYHRNIQKVKAQEAELATKAREAEARAIQQYQERLETYKAALVKSAAPELQNVDLNRLAMEDPAEAQRIFFKQMQFNQTLQQIENERIAAQQALQHQSQAAQREALQKAQEILASEVPGWGEELQKNLTRTAIDDYGFRAEELAQVADARVIKLIHDAHLYRQLQKAKPELGKKVVALPKVLKPGSANQSSPAKETADRAFERVRKTGRVEDAVAAYLSRQKK